MSDDVRFGDDGRAGRRGDGCNDGHDEERECSSSIKFFSHEFFVDLDGDNSMDYYRGETSSRVMIIARPPSSSTRKNLQALNFQKFR